MGTFSEALEHLKSNRLIKREVIKNDTVVVNYKDRLYQMSKKTGVRYPYVPTNKDLMSNDWLVLSDRGNALVDQTVKNDTEKENNPLIKKGDEVIAWTDTHCKVIEIQGLDAVCEDSKGVSFIVELESLKLKIKQP